MFKKGLALLLCVALLCAAVGTVCAVQQDGSFVLAAVSANSTVIAPVSVSYKAGQTIAQALAVSGYEFSGLEQGFVYAIEGVSANYSLYYDGGEYDLQAPASGVTALCFHVSGAYSEQALALICRMAEYAEMENHVQNDPAASDAYAQALEGLRTADASAAQSLLDALNAAISEYEARLEGTKYTVCVTAWQNGSVLTAPTVTLTDAYGNQTSGMGAVQVVAGSYTFCVSDGGYNRTEGSVSVSGETELELTLPSGQWLGEIRLLDRNKEPYRCEQDESTHTAQYWVEDTADIVADLYLNAQMGDVPDETATKLKTIYVGTNGVDRSDIPRSWNSTATALTYLVEPGMTGRSFDLEAQYTDAQGYRQIQSYALTLTRVPTLSALRVTADGAALPLQFSPTTRSYELTTVASALDICAEAFGTDYTVSGTGNLTLTGRSCEHRVLVTAPNGSSSVYTLHITKADAACVTVTAQEGVSTQIFNAAGAEMVPSDGVYRLVPGESYTCLATKNTYYHTETVFTASDGMNVTAQTPIAEDWLENIALYNGTNVNSRLSYEPSEPFAAQRHAYCYAVSDCNSSLGIQATALRGSVTVKYTTQDKNVYNHGVEMNVAVTNAVSETGSAKSLANALEKSGFGNTLTLRISETQQGVIFYQDYTLKLVKQLHLSALSLSGGESALPLLNENGESVAFDRDVTDYFVRVNRQATELLLSGSFPNAAGETDCCGGYSAAVNETAYDELDGVRVALDPALEQETLSVRVSHTDPDSLDTTYTIHIQKIEPIRLSVQTDPANAVVFFTDDVTGSRISAEQGVYALTPGGSYSYTVTCAGYIGKQVSHYLAPEADSTLFITLKQAPENTLLQELSSIWPHLRPDNTNNGVIDRKTPVCAENAQLYWATRIGDGFDANACGCPIIVDGYLYTYSGSTLYKVSTLSGEIVATAPMDHASSFAINPPTYAEGMLFVGLADGTVQAFNAATLESLWIYRDKLGGQPNCPIVYHDGYVYTGFWVGETSEANYVCLSATDEDPSQSMEEKLPTWYYTSKGGFYWAGAYVCDDFLLIGTDDGASGYTTGYAALLSLDPKTGEVRSCYEMSVPGDIRSSVTCCDGAYYFTSKGGYFFRADVTQSGLIADVRALRLDNYANDSANPAMSTSTPTVYHGRAYVGVSGTSQFGAYSGHNITVIDLENWEIAYSVPTQGYPQTSSVLTTAYEEQTGCVYVYFFDNFTPGKLRVLEDRPGQNAVSLKTVESYSDAGNLKSFDTPYNLFTPVGEQAQYVICSPVVDEYGTIYFKNDSGYLMAVGSAVERLEITKQPDRLSYRAGECFDGAGMQVTAYFANGLSRDVTDCVTWSTLPLTAEDTDFQLTFPYVMYQNRETETAMEYGVACTAPSATVVLTVEASGKLGDVNGDGAVDSTDAALIYRFANGRYALPEALLETADVNGDGAVDSTDAALIYRFANGTLAAFPAQNREELP